MSLENPTPATPSEEEEEVEEVKIAEAAIKYKDHVFTGPTHGDAYALLTAQFPDVTSREYEEGFTTKNGQFVDREHAAHIAKRAGQLDHLGGDALGEAERSLNSGDMPDTQTE